MKPERSIKELLIVLRDNLKDYFDLYCNGMCLVIKELYWHDLISEEEESILTNYLEDNKPIDQMYWFVPGEIEPRLEWLNQQIEKL